MAKKLSDSDYDDYFRNMRKKNGKKNTGHNGKWYTRKWNIIAGSLVILFLAFIIYVFSGLPSLEELENPKPQLASKVYTSDGELLGQFFIENRIETNIDSLPPYIINALVATEDRRFYSHWGVDLQRFFTAMVKNVFTFSREGASTITQQLAKNLYRLKGRDENAFQTGIRKIREWITAIQIEKNFTKREILELYYNVSYFGRSAYGIESAAQVYFNKKAANLTLSEVALFVALLKSPEYYDPIRNKENALRRRNVVLRNMVNYGMLDENDYQNLREQPIVLASEKISGVKSIAPHFMEYVRKYLESISPNYDYDLYRDGLNIYTTLDFRMQKVANKAASDHLKEYQQIFNKNWNWDKNKSLLSALVDRAIRSSEEYRSAETPEEKADVYNRLKSNEKFIERVKKSESTIQVGFVAIDPANGYIRALVGGENQDFGRGLNHVTGIRRQPGSSFKPVIYLSAIENGYYPAYTLLNQKFNYNGWSPENANFEYGGYITLREALAFSVNVIAGRMTTSNMAPPSQVVRIAKRLGINSSLSQFPSIALGTSELTPLELTSAFGTIANNGIHVNPIAVLRIEDRNGILIDEFVPEYSEAISPQSAAILTDMMQDVVNYGTGAGVRRYFHRPAAGKTGTTQNFSDAWFVGFTPQLVAGAWVGFDDHRIKFTNWYGQGAKAALPIWAMFMEGVYKELNLPLKYFELPSEIRTEEFCKETLDLGDPRIANENCPEKVTDIINPKNIPALCEIHSGSPKIRRDDNRGDTGW
jgi:penicillin-binding protein 1A